MLPASRARAAAGRIVLGALALVVLLFVTEWVVRLVAPEPPPLRFVQLEETLRGTSREEFTQLIEPDPDTFWRLAPDLVGPDDAKLFPGRISNGQGLREDREIPHAKPADELRILILGASATYGFKLRPEETLAHHLERRLQPQFPDHRIECINAAVPGYGLFQGWQFLRSKGFAYRPDLVLADFGWNDAAVQLSLIHI